MFVNERLIYLQLQKTGCTHVAMLLDKLIGGEQVGKHNRLPARLESEGRLIVGSVRNPWDWYVSLWAFGCEQCGGLADRLTSGFTFRGHGVFSFDPDRNVNVMTWWDSFGGTRSEYLGNWSGDVLTLEAQTPQGPARAVFDLSTAGEYGFRMEVSPDGKQWFPFMEGCYRRSD